MRYVRLPVALAASAWVIGHASMGWAQGATDCNVALIQDKISFQQSEYSRLYYSYLRAQAEQSSDYFNGGATIPIKGVPVTFDAEQSKNIERSLLEQMTKVVETSVDYDLEYSFLSKAAVSAYQSCLSIQKKEVASLQVGAAWREALNNKGERDPSGDYIEVFYSGFIAPDQLGRTPKLKSLKLLSYSGTPLSKSSSGGPLVIGSTIKRTIQGANYNPLIFKPPLNGDFTVHIEAEFTAEGVEPFTMSKNAHARKPLDLRVSYNARERHVGPIMETRLAFSNGMRSNMYASNRVIIRPGPQDGSDTWARSNYVFADHALEAICRPIVLAPHIALDGKQTCQWSLDEKTQKTDYKTINAGYEQKWVDDGRDGGQTVLTMKWTDIYPVLRVGNHAVGDVPREVICDLGLDNKPLGWPENAQVCSASLN